MNWKNILQENLSILGFDYTELAAKKIDQLNLFKIANRQAFLKIIMFIIFKHEPNIHEEFSKLSLLVSDKRIQREYLRKLHSWCTEMIIKTFSSYTVSINLFVSPIGSKVYELLGRLTSCSIKWTIMNVYGNSNTIRNPVIISNLNKMKISSSSVLACLKDDFNQEIKAYFQYLNNLLTKRDIFCNKIKELKRQIAMTKPIIGVNVEKENMETNLLNTINIESLDISDYDIETKFEKINQCIKDFIEDMEIYKNICETIVNKFVSNMPMNKIEIPKLMRLNEKVNSNLFSKEGKLSLNEVINMISTELLIDSPIQKNILIHRELDRVKSGLEHFADNMKLQLNKTVSLYKELDTLKTEINKGHYDTVFQDLSSYGQLPSVELLLETCAEPVIEKEQTKKVNFDVQKENLYKPDYIGINNTENSSFNISSNSISMNSFLSTNDDSEAAAVHSDCSSLDPRYLIRTPVKLLQTKSQSHFEDQLFDLNTSGYQLEKVDNETLSSLMRKEMEYSRNDFIKTEVFNVSQTSDGNFFEKSNDSFMECLYQDL